MKKKAAGVILVFITCSLILININKEKNKPIIENQSQNNNIINTNVLTMMYETEAGSGEYVVANDTTWPQDGYLFNETLSGCENGGTLSWNNETNRVVLTTSTSDKCYVYFDKYNAIEITNIIATNVTYNSISVSITTNSGTNNAANYYYSINNGAYVSSTSNTYTFSNLNDNTQYSISAYVVDTNNISSNTFSTNISTTILDIPVINSASVGLYNCDESAGPNYINIDITSDSDITEAYLTMDGKGPYAGSNISNTYFEYDPWLYKLNYGSSYSFTIYVVNSAGFTSNVYSGTFYADMTCFVAGTKVETINGHKNIEDIKIGDLVSSFNEKNKKVEYNKVTNTFVHQDNEIYEIHYKNEIIKVTPYHRFYVNRDNKLQWIIAKDLLKSDKLIDGNNNEILINNINHYEEKNTVYNIEVEKNHNYYITHDNILVHNVKGPCV